jgi:hypothetical protein
MPLPASHGQLEPLLVEIRTGKGLVEKKRGIFYRKSVAFHHFHDDPTGLYADVRGECVIGCSDGPSWIPSPVPSVSVAKSRHGMRYIPASFE